MQCALGIDLGGTKLLAILLDSQNRLVTVVRKPTGPHLDPAAALRLIERVVRELTSHGHTVDALGIGFPGLVDSGGGRVHSSVILRGWEEVPFAVRVSERLDIPCAIDNDVNCAARAEMRARGGPRCSDMMFIAVGTGVGGALVLGGRIWCGASGLAGEIGHVSVSRRGPRCNCGRRGCVNMLASGQSIERRLNFPEGGLAQAIREGDRRVRRAVQEAAGALGAGIGSVLNLLNLPLVVLGGGIAELGEPYRAAVQRATEREAFREVTTPCRIELARSGYGAGAVGAALLANEVGTGTFPEILAAS